MAFAAAFVGGVMLVPRTLALSGSYPRSETLVKATWNFDKNLLDQNGLDKVRLDEAKQLVALQEKLGFSSVTDGNLAWQDAFRGIIEASSAFEVGGVTRLFETNRFYRQPILRGKNPSPDVGALGRVLLLDKIKTKRAKRAILPSPYWLAKATKVENGQTFEAAADTLAEYVNACSKWLEAQGYTELHFNEPLLFYEKGGDTKLAGRLIKTALKGLRADTTVNFPNGDAGRNLPWAANLPATTIGVDFVETYVVDLAKGVKLNGLLAAVVDSQESLLESPEEVDELVTGIEKRLAPKSTVLSHTWDLEFNPNTNAEKKLEILARVATQKVNA